VLAGGKLILGNTRRRAVFASVADGSISSTIELKDRSRCRRWSRTTRYMSRPEGPPDRVSLIQVPAMAVRAGSKGPARCFGRYIPFALHAVFAAHIPREEFHPKPLPTVAIIGRPNVGKSTLFNRLVGKRIALVDDRPGVTRDRREGDANLLGLEFRIFDTAGYEDKDAASLPGRMRAQTEAAVNDADVALFLIDSRAGVTPLDEEIARWLRSTDTPIILVANKAEGRAGETGVIESLALGFGDPVQVSAEHGEGMADLFEALLPHVEREDRRRVEEEDPDNPNAPLKLAIVGRPNAGKSTLVNRMLGEDRMITGPRRGSRAIRSRSIGSGKISRATSAVRLIDTAGMRKKREGRGQAREAVGDDTLRAIDFAEVVVLLLDATRGLEVQDLKIADRSLQEGRALIIALNKWDVAEKPPACSTA
jgi:GTP-binding protein